MKAKPIPTAPSTDDISTEKPVRTTGRQRRGGRELHPEHPWEVTREVLVTSGGNSRADLSQYRVRTWIIAAPFLFIGWNLHAWSKRHHRHFGSRGTETQTGSAMYARQMMS